MYGGPNPDGTPQKRQKVEHVSSCGGEMGNQYIPSPQNYGVYSGSPSMYLGQGEPLENLPPGSMSPLSSLNNLINNAGYHSSDLISIKAEADDPHQQNVNQGVPPSHSPMQHSRHQLQQMLQHQQSQAEDQLQQYQAHLGQQQQAPQQGHYYDQPWAYNSSNDPYNQGTGWSPDQVSQIPQPPPQTIGQEYSYQENYQTPYIDPQTNAQQYYSQYGYTQAEMSVSAQAYTHQGDVAVSHNGMYGLSVKQEENTPNSVEYRAASSTVATSYGQGRGITQFSQGVAQHYSYSSHPQTEHHHQQNSMAPEYMQGYPAGMGQVTIKTEPNYPRNYGHSPSNYGQEMSMPSMGSVPHPGSYQQGYTGGSFVSPRPVVEAKPDTSASMLCTWDSMEPVTGSLPEQFIALELRLTHMLKGLSFGEPVTHIYNPLEYAIEPHTYYVNTYCSQPKPVLFLGMNPGPYGMAQTGVPFGEINLVKDWLKIEGEVQKPEKEHPKRPVWGLDCPRSEVSGARFWGFLKSICIRPENFFRHCFVHSYCPLLFMAQSGRNLTPPDLRVAERRPLNDICDRAFCDVVKLLNAKIIIGVGKFAQERAKAALRNSGMLDIKVECIMHPSPANPTANKGWQPIVEKQLNEMGVMPFLVPEDITVVERPLPESGFLHTQQAEDSNTVSSQQPPIESPVTSKQNGMDQRNGDTCGSETESNDTDTVSTNGKNIGAKDNENKKVVQQTGVEEGENKEGGTLASCHQRCEESRQHDTEGQSPGQQSKDQGAAEGEIKGPPDQETTADKGPETEDLSQASSVSTVCDNTEKNGEHPLSNVQDEHVRHGVPPSTSLPPAPLPDCPHPQ